MSSSSLSDKILLKNETEDILKLSSDKRLIKTREDLLALVMVQWVRINN